MEKKKAVLYVNLAVLLFGAAGLFAKGLALPAVVITFGRVFFSFAALLLYTLAARQPFKIKSQKHLGLFVLAGGLLALHWWSFLQSIKLSTVAVGTITFSAFPMFVTFLEPLVFHRRLTLKNVLLALFILAGVLVTVPEFSLGSRQVQGIAVGLVSALAYAALTLINKALSDTYPGTTVALYEQGVAAVLLFPCLWFADFRVTAADIGLLLILGVFMTAFAHTLFINSLRSLPAQLAGVCSSMETVYGILFAALIFGEIPGLRECAGAAIIIGVVVYAQLTVKTEPGEVEKKG